MGPTRVPLQSVYIDSFTRTSVATGDMAESVYAINASGIAHELLEGEAILINFKTGSYYSLDGIGGVVWQHLCSGPATASGLASALLPAGSPNHDALEATLSLFLKELAGEELVVLSDEPAATPVAAGVPLPDGFEPPALRKYTDLEALLLLDPIHDVDGSGWPSTPPPAR